MSFLHSHLLLALVVSEDLEHAGNGPSAILVRNHPLGGEELGVLRGVVVVNIGDVPRRDLEGEAADPGAALVIFKEAEELRHVKMDELIIEGQFGDPIGADCGLAGGQGAISWLPLCLLSSNYKLNASFVRTRNEHSGGISTVVNRRNAEPKAANQLSHNVTTLRDVRVCRGSLCGKTGVPGDFHRRPDLLHRIQALNAGLSRSETGGRRKIIATLLKGLVIRKRKQFLSVKVNVGEREGRRLRGGERGWKGEKQQILVDASDFR